MKKSIGSTDNYQSGFTLIEIMVVISIIGILASIAIPQFSAYRNRAFMSALQSDAHVIANAQEAYFTVKHLYAGSLDQLRNDTYGVEISNNTSVPAGSWIADSTSFSFTCIDTLHGNISVSYKSARGGFQ